MKFTSLKYFEKICTHLNVTPDFGFGAGPRVAIRARTSGIITDAAGRGCGLDGRFLRFLNLCRDCRRRVGALLLLLLLLLRGCLLLLLLLLLLRLLHDLLDELQLLFCEAIVAGTGRRGTLENRSNIIDISDKVSYA